MQCFVALRNLVSRMLSLSYILCMTDQIIYPFSEKILIFDTSNVKPGKQTSFYSVNYSEYLFNKRTESKKKTEIFGGGEN